MTVLVLWTGKWPLVVLGLILPVLIVPLVSMLLYPEVPLTTPILLGLIISLFVAIGLRTIQSAKALGTQFFVATAVVAVFIGLLLVILVKLLS